MKLTLGAIIALASCAAAAQPTADVYILPTRDAASPSLPRSLARLILLERLATNGQGLSINEISNDKNREQAVSWLNLFGKTIPPLFTNDDVEEPRQLVIILEGMTEQQIRDTGKQLDVQPSFSISDPPAAVAHEKLMRNDFYNAGVTNEHKCSLERVTNPFEEECWSGKATVAKYNIQKNPNVLTAIVNRFPKLASLANAGEMETTLLLLPSVNENAATRQWSDKTELRRRQAEQVISSFGKTAAPVAPTSSASPTNVFKAPTGRIPACFDSVDSCISSTGNCSHQGQCLNKFGPVSAKGEGACFACHCLSTRDGKHGPLTHWAGPVCAKKDISVPFWLFAGFTLLMLGVLSVSVTMLYSVGNERLPGVIGAGVSKSNK